MWSWIPIIVLVLLAPRLLRAWNRYKTRVNLLHLPLSPPSCREAALDEISPAIRDGLAAAAAELAALGFEFIGYVQSSDLPDDSPRIRAVLRHPVERTFAAVGFALAERNGVIVDFETLFEDGWWFRTVNRRGHFVVAQPATGVTADPFVATLGEQWQYHLGAVAYETARTRRDGGLAELIRHWVAVDEDEFAAGARAGAYDPAPDGKGFRFTRAGADALMQRLADANARAAAVPPLAGVLAMRNPADEVERKYQNILLANARRPKSRARWAFLLSVIAFAASAMLFKHWAWLLWVIPFLLFHELGHWAAMRLFGHRDATIRFIPFLGAATLTTTQFRKLSHEMIVLLAGPVPGILLGFALFQLADFGRNPYLVGIAITLIIINGLNLLPLHPLDGGRILHALVTAGRPHLDVALKAAAGALFVAAAIAFKDVTLVLLAALGFFLVRPGLRLARIEQQVRRQPGFGPALTPQQRRRLIFDALPDQLGVAEASWVRLVQQLEVSLSHGLPRLWPSLPWALVYAGCLGGLVAWSASVLAVGRVTTADCPPRARAAALACAAPADAQDIDWSRRDPGSLTRNPFKLASRTDYPFAAFVWCTGQEPAMSRMRGRLREVVAAGELCPALPWETLPEAGTEQRERARMTMSALSPAGARMTQEQRLAYLDKFETTFGVDTETARLYRAWLTNESDGEAKRLLSERIGRSPSESCKRLRILGASRDHDGTNGLSATFAAPEDFAPLRRWLCEAGCERVDVLPYGSLDPRLRFCL